MKKHGIFRPAGGEIRLRVSDPVNHHFAAVRVLLRSLCREQTNRGQKTNMMVDSYAPGTRCSLYGA